MTADISHFKVFFFSDTAVWKMAVNFKLVLESPTNSTYSRGSLSNRTSVIRALSPKGSKKNIKELFALTTVFFALFVKLRELTFKHKKKLKCLKKSHAWP